MKRDFHDEDFCTYCANPELFACLGFSCSSHWVGRVKKWKTNAPREHPSVDTSLVYGALLGGAGGPGRGSSRPFPGPLLLSRQPPRRSSRRAARQPAAGGAASASAEGGLRVSVRDSVSTPGEGAADGVFAAGSECESGSIKALGWFVATQDERREKPVSGAVQGYRTQLLLERNMHSFRYLCNVEGGGMYLRVGSNCYGLQTSRDV